MEDIEKTRITATETMMRKQQEEQRVFYKNKREELRREINEKIRNDAAKALFGIGEVRIDDERDAVSYVCGGIKNFIKTNEEEDNMASTSMGCTGSEPKDMWGLYEVVVVEKDKIGITKYAEINKKVVAKNEEHAKGLAGVNDLLEKYNYDNTKIAIKVDKIMDIKPVEDDE